MRAGALRHRITLQIPALTRNAMGEYVPTYADWATVWGSIEPNSGKRFMEALQANSEIQGSVLIRYRDGLRPDMRIKYGNRILDIISIVHIAERRRDIRIYYKEAQD